MTIELTWQTVVTAGAVVAAATTIITLLVKLVHWVDRQKQQDKDIKQLREQHDKDLRAIQHEQTLIAYGILAALRGLKEQGCNGPVTEAIDKIDKHLNQKAHGEGKA